MPVLGILKKIASPVLGIVDKAINDKDLATQLKHDIEMTILEQGVTLEQEISKRHEMDMQSDSWLSKNVRPMTLIFLLFVFVLISFFDGNIGKFGLNESYIPVYETLLSLAFTFYFGSRGIEKSMKIYTKKEKKREE